MWQSDHYRKVCCFCSYREKMRMVLPSKALVKFHNPYRQKSLIFSVCSNVFDFGSMYGTAGKSFEQYLRCRDHKFRQLFNVISATGGLFKSLFCTHKNNSENQPITWVGRLIFGLFVTLICVTDLTTLVRTLIKFHLLHKVIAFFLIF